MNASIEPGRVELQMPDQFVDIKFDILFGLFLFSTLTSTRWLREAQFWQFWTQQYLKFGSFDIDVMPTYATSGIQIEFK